MIIIKQRGYSSLPASADNNLRIRYKELIKIGSCLLCYANMFCSDSQPGQYAAFELKELGHGILSYFGQVQNYL